ncbi:MAG: terpene synthase family protein [Trebonia sp.]
MAEQEPERAEFGQVIKLPAFDLPFPSDIHPSKESVIEHTSRWAVATGLVRDQEAAERLRRNGIMHAGPRLAPAASMDAACLTCDWTVFLIVIDDEFDDGAELGVRPDLARVAIEDVIAAFRGEASGRATSYPPMAGISAAAAELGRRFAAESPSLAWLARFRHHAEAHIWSKVSEAEHRAAAGFLDVPSYVALRRVTSAAYTYTDLVELVAGAVITEWVQDSPAWGRMLDAAADAWLGIQDICSCAKEVSAGDDLNLAAVMAHSSGSTIQQGIDDAYRWVRGRSGDIATHRAQLDLGLGSGGETDMARYLNGLGHLLGGHLAWSSQDNPRYAQVISSI